jgi:transposase-like protein
VTDKIVSLLKKWQQRPLEAVYPFVWLDAIHYKIKEDDNRQFRKLTKTKGGFPNENSLLKLLYMGIQNAQKKWTLPMQNWSLTISQLVIFFEGRLDEALEL